MDTKKMAIIATKGTLDWAYPPFILASTAAAAPVVTSNPETVQLAVTMRFAAASASARIAAGIATPPPATATSCPSVAT